METKKMICKECGKEFYLSYEATLTDFRGLCYDCNLKNNSAELKAKCEKYDALFPKAISLAFELQSVKEALKASNLQNFAALSDEDFESICYILNTLEYFCQKGLWQVADITFEEFFRLYQEQHYSAFPSAIPLFVHLTTRGLPEDRCLIEAEEEEDSLAERDDSAKKQKDRYRGIIPEGLSAVEVFDNQFSEKLWADFLAKRFWVYDFVMGNHSKTEKKAVLEGYEQLIDNKIPIHEFKTYNEVMAEEYVREHEAGLAPSAEECAMNFFHPATVIPVDRDYMMNDEVQLYDSVLAYDLYIAYSGCRIIGGEKWLTLFAEYVFQWCHLIMGGDDVKAAFAECAQKDWKGKLAGCVRLCKIYLDAHKEAVKALNEKTMDSIANIDEIDVRSLFLGIPESIDMEFAPFFEDSFEYERDMELLEMNVAPELKERIEDRLLEEYEVIERSELSHEAEMALSALGMVTEALSLVFNVLEMEYENDEALEEHLELTEEVLSDTINLLYSRPFAIKKVLKEKRPDILEKAEQQAETLEEAERILSFISMTIAECKTSKQLMEWKNNWMKTLEIHYISEAKVEEILNTIMKRLEEMESVKECYREEEQVIASYLECDREYRKDSVKATLTTGEILYREYIAENRKLADYGCIGIMYYRALEDLANKLLYTPYYCQVLKKQGKAVMCEPEKYVGRLQNFIRKGTIKDSCEIGTLGFLLKDVAERPEYAAFLKKWLSAPLDYKVIQKIGNELICVSKRRNEMAHGGKNIGCDTVVVARTNVYRATEVKLQDDLLQISELIKKILSLF